MSRASRLVAWLRRLPRSVRREARDPRAGSPQRSARLRLAVLAPGETRIPSECDFVYAPLGREHRLDADALDNALLSLSHEEHDFALVSRSLAELPSVAATAQPRDSLVFSVGAAGFFVDGTPLRRRLRGRLLRMPGLGAGCPRTTLPALFQGVRVEHSTDEIALGEPAEEAPRRSWLCAAHPFVPPRPAGKPRVFVWPALWAVGGVERNTIEIMRQLRDDYDFVVVTTERLTERTGSLHHPLKGLATATYDLAECARPWAHLSMLASLKRVYRPQLVWICNGSSWQCDHATAIRELYADVPIVDQQVYDTRAGWINRYAEPGIQSFDRFIAINEQILDSFVGRLGMDPARIDLIHPAFDGDRFEPEAFPPERVAELRRAHGLRDGSPLYLFIGRMAAQKRPLDFLRLAERLEATGEDADFMLLGDGELAADVDAFIRARTRRVVRRSFTDDVPEVLAMADGLVITSAYEGLPIVMVEALAMGLPVLSTDVGDVRRVLEEYGSGAVVPRIGDVDALEAAFRAWRARLPDYTEAARKSARRVRERFSAAQAAARFDACWRAAIAAGRTPPGGSHILRGRVRNGRQNP